MLLRVSAPAMLPVALAGTSGHEYVLGLTLEQPRLSASYADGALRVERRGVEELLSREIEAIVEGVGKALEGGRVETIYESAGRAGLKGWAGSLAAAGLSFGGLLLLGGRKDTLYPVVSRSHLDPMLRVVIILPECVWEKPVERYVDTGLLLDVMAEAAQGSLEATLEAWARLGEEAEKVYGYPCRDAEIMGKVAKRMAEAAGPTPTGAIYALLRVTRRDETCVVAQAISVAELAFRDIILSNPQNVGARFVVEQG